MTVYSHFPRTHEDTPIKRDIIKNRPCFSEVALYKVITYSMVSVALRNFYFAYFWEESSKKLSNSEVWFIRIFLVFTRITKRELCCQAQFKFQLAFTLIITKHPPGNTATTNCQKYRVGTLTGHVKYCIVHLKLSDRFVQLWMILTIFSFVHP